MYSWASSSHNTVVDSRLRLVRLGEWPCGDKWRSRARGDHVSHTGYLCISPVALKSRQAARAIERWDNSQVRGRY
jgi:hypothetical protein